MPAQIPSQQNITEEIYKRGLELLEERRHAEDLLHNISEGVIGVNEDYTVGFVNLSAEELLGTKSADIVGKKIFEVLALKDTKNNALETSQYCFTQGEKEIDNLNFERSDGRLFYLRLHSATILNAQQAKECIITLTDVTKEKKLEKTKDDFISITSHELRTPMTIIKSYIWMLSTGKGGTLTEKQSDYVKKAAKAVDRMLAMINDTLNVSKIEQNKIELRVEEIDIKDFLDDLEPDFKIKAEEKNLYFKTELAEEIKFVFADKGKLREIILNLVGNSIKFTQTGGVILTVRDSGKAGLAEFRITDTGKGIKQDDIKRLFHKFGRLDNSYQTVAEAGGTGLGLYITKSLVETMGGTVGVESKGEGSGSVFWFTLPTNYLGIPEPLRKFSILSLATPVETSITSICPV